MSTNSLRLRIVILLSTAQAVIAGCCILGTFWYLVLEIRASLDAEVTTRMTAVLAHVHPADEQPGGLQFSQHPSEINPRGDLLFLKTQKGETIAGSSEWIPGALRSKLPGNTLDFWWNGQHYRGAAWVNKGLPDEEDQNASGAPILTLFYAIPASESDQKLARIAAAAALIALSVFILTVGAAWWALSLGLRPVFQLVNAARKIDVNQWHIDSTAEAFRTPELAPLTLALAQLLERLRSAFDREKRFLSDAAHELKTAIAIQKSTLQLLDRDMLSPREYRKGIGIALEDTARTETLIGEMLELARVESRDRVDLAIKGAASLLSDSLLLAVEDFQSLSVLNRVDLRITGNVEVEVYGQSDDLVLVWRNLIANAVQHSAADSAVDINVSVSPEEVEVTVHNYGDSIPPDDLPHVFERFYRVDGSRSRLTGGFGLGLSIAEAVVLRVGGAIQLKSDPNEGTCATVTLRRIRKSTTLDSAVLDGSLRSA